MAVAPLIAMKSTKVQSLEAMGRELDRRAHTYVNDVDGSGRHIGFRVRQEDTEPMPLEKALERRMSELNTRRKIRDNQVRAMGFVVSSNDALVEEDAQKFLTDSINWFGARYGFDNLLAAQIHLDEGTPHAHIWIAPVIHEKDGYDRLCAKELFSPDVRRKNSEGKYEVVAKGTMSQLQDDFWSEVARGYGYEPPLKSELRKKGYKSLEAFKTHTGKTRELKQQLLKTERELKEANSAHSVASAALKELQKNNRELSAAAQNLSVEIEHKKKILSETEGSLLDTRAKLDGLQNHVEKKQAQAAQMDSDIAKKTKTIEDQNATVAQNSKKMKQQKNEIENLKSEIETRREIANEFETMAWDEQQKFDYARKQVQNENEKLEGIKAQVDKKRSQAATIDKNISKKNEILSGLQNEINKEEQRLESVRRAGNEATKRVEFLESIVGLLRKFENARGGERGSILAQVARQIREFIDGRKQGVQGSLVPSSNAIEEQQTAIESRSKTSRGLQELAREKRAESQAINAPTPSAADVRASVKSARQQQSQSQRPIRRSHGR